MSDEKYTGKILTLNCICMPTFTFHHSAVSEQSHGEISAISYSRRHSAN